MNSVEEKIIDILFKDLIIADVMVDKLLPPITLDSDATQDMHPDDIYNIARDELRRNIQRVVKK